MFVDRASRMEEIKAAGARAAMATKVAGARTAKPEDPVSHDIRKYSTWPQQDGRPEGYRRRLLDSDDEDELAMLPVDQRAMARSTKVIRRYVPSAAPTRTAPPPEDPIRMQAWLGRVIPVPAHHPSRQQPGDRPRRPTSRGAKPNTSERSKAAGRWTSGFRGHARRTLLWQPLLRLTAVHCSRTITASDHACRHLQLQPRHLGGGLGLESRGSGAPDQVTANRTSALDLSRIRTPEYERLRPERERQEAQRQ